MTHKVMPTAPNKDPTLTFSFTFDVIMLIFWRVRGSALFKHSWQTNGSPCFEQNVLPHCTQ